VARIEQSNTFTVTAKSAGYLLALDPHHPLALDILAVEDLMAAWVAGEGYVARQSDGEPVRLEPFTMPGGEPVTTLLTHPPAEVSFRVQLPAEPVLLAFRTALAPQSWSWGGDGVHLSIRLESAGSDPVILYEERITGASVDQTWHTGRISLAAYAGQEVDITLVAEPGPAGDYTGDWAGWADLLLIRDLAVTP